VAILLIGVAGSSSFQHSREVTLAPGQQARIDGLTVRYVKPTVAASSQRLSFGADLAVYQGRKLLTKLQTTRGFYPSQDPTLGPISRFFNGEADSNVGLQAGLTRDIWTVVNPDLTPLQGLIGQGDRLFTAAIRKAQASSPAQLGSIWQLRDEAIVGIASRYASHPWPINFLLIVDPLVSWIWIGAIIVALGGLIALWPVPARARKRAPVTAPARPPAPAVAAVREPV
jgi:cytochrome c-type biogenesis protein CcmF